MVKLESFTTKISKLLNEVSIWAIVAAMLLVVLNIILRVLFSRPILGTYEYTSFLAAIIVSCGIAYCAVQNAHIAVDFIIEKFSPATQRIIEAITGVIIVFSMTILSWKIYAYAGQLMKSGEVSPTTKTPFYLFVYVIAFSFTVLCLVHIARLEKTISDMINPKEVKVK